MTMKNKISLIAGALMLLIPVLSVAQALPFAGVSTDVSSLGKAGADAVETASVRGAAFGNVAAVPFSGTTLDVAAGYAMWKPTSGNIISVSGAYSLGGKLGLAAGFSYGMNPEYGITDPSGASKGTFRPTDMQLAVGASYRFLPYLSVGANVGYASSSLAEGHSYGAVTADAFVMGQFSGVKVALGVTDLGSAVTSASGAKFSLPTALTLGAGYAAVLADKHALDLQLEADYYLEGAFAAALGAEYAFDEMVFLRAGYRYGGDSVLPSFASVGAGAKFMGIRLDVAYLIGPGALANTIAVGLGYSF